jgi:hypothetical protein
LEITKLRCLEKVRFEIVRFETPLTHDFFLGWQYYFIHIREGVEFALSFEHDEQIRIAGDSNVITRLEIVVFPLSKLL